MGPYTFTKYHRKTNVTFSPDATTVSFNEFFSLHPVPELTNGSLSDPVTTLNVALVGAIEGILAKSPAALSGWLSYLARLVEGWSDPRIQGLFTTRPAGELLFGYRDPLLAKLAHVFPGINPHVALVPNMTAAEETHPDPAQKDVVATGVDDIANVAQFRAWRGMEHVDAWRPPHREPVVGTDATQFRPGLRKGDSLTVWVGDVFRYFTLIEGFGPGADDAHVGPVPVLRFRPDPTQRDPDPRYYQTVPGLMNITAPMAAASGGVGPPLFLSLPGFCYADPSLAEGVEGIECDHLRHDIHIDVEPTTGIALGALKTLMLNSWFGQRYKAVDPHVEDTFLPIFWAHESTQAAPEQLAGFRVLLLAQGVRTFLDGRGAPKVAAAAAVVGVAALVGAVLMGRSPETWNEEEEERRAGGDDLEAHLLPAGASDGGGPQAPASDEALTDAIAAEG